MKGCRNTFIFACILVSVISLSIGMCSCKGKKPAEHEPGYAGIEKAGEITIRDMDSIDYLTHYSFWQPNDSFIKTHVERSKLPKAHIDSLFEVVIGSIGSRYATRDTFGVWKIYNAEKALELMYQSYWNKANDEKD